MRRRLFGTKKRKLATLLVVGSLAAAGAGLAAWLVTGSGPGHSTIGGLVPPSVTFATPTDPIRFGDPGGVAFDITNPDGNPTLYVKTATYRAADGVGVEPPCDPTHFVIPPTVAGLSIEVPPGPVFVEIPDVIGMVPEIPEECANKTVQTNWDLQFSTAP